MKFTYNKAKTRRTYIRFNTGWTFYVSCQENRCGHKPEWAWEWVEDALPQSFTSYKAACRAAREWREK